MFVPVLVLVAVPVVVVAVTPVVVAVPDVVVAVLVELFIKLNTCKVIIRSESEAMFKLMSAPPFDVFRTESEEDASLLFIRAFGVNSTDPK